MDPVPFLTLQVLFRLYGIFHSSKYRQPPETVTQTVSAPRRRPNIPKSLRGVAFSDATIPQ